MCLCAGEEFAHVDIRALSADGAGPLLDVAQLCPQRARPAGPSQVPGPIREPSHHAAHGAESAHQAQDASLVW